MSIEHITRIKRRAKLIQVSWLHRAVHS